MIVVQDQYPVFHIWSGDSHYASWEVRAPWIGILQSTFYKCSYAEIYELVVEYFELESRATNPPFKKINKTISRISFGYARPPVEVCLVFAKWVPFRRQTPLSPGTMAAAFIVMSIFDLCWT